MSEQPEEVVVELEDGKKAVVPLGLYVATGTPRPVSERMSDMPPPEARPARPAGEGTEGSEG